MPRATIITLVMAALLAVGALVVYHTFNRAQTMPAVLREANRLRLQTFAAAFQAYRGRHGGTWPPDLRRLEHEAGLRWDSAAVAGAGVYHYQPPPAGSGAAWILMWSDGAQAAVPQGAPWAGGGQAAPHDEAAVCFVLTSGLVVETLAPAEQRRRLEAQRSRAAALRPTITH